MNNVETYSPPSQISEYWKWLCLKIKCDEYDISKYRKLLLLLITRDFRLPNWYIHNKYDHTTIHLDANRIADGIALRYQYGDEKMMVTQTVTNKIDIYEHASVMEVLYALACRMRAYLLEDDDIWDTPSLFWMFIENLKLDSYIDDEFDEVKINDILDKWMDREFGIYGVGNIIRIANTDKDLRLCQFWDHAIWWVSALDETRKAVNNYYKKL